MEDNFSYLFLALFALVVFGTSWIGIPGLWLEADLTSEDFLLYIPLDSIYKITLLEISHNFEANKTKCQLIENREVNHYNVFHPQEKIIKLSLSWIIVFMWNLDPSACQHRLSLVAVEVAPAVAAAAVATAKRPLWGHLSRHWLSLQGVSWEDYCS